MNRPDPARRDYSAVASVLTTSPGASVGASVGTSVGASVGAESVPLASVGLASVATPASNPVQSLGNHAQLPVHISCVMPLSGPVMVPGRQVWVPAHMPQKGVFVQSSHVEEWLPQNAFAFGQYDAR